MIRSLFDPPEPIPTEPPSVAKTATEPAPRPRIGDAVRTIEHKKGPFRWLVDTDPKNPKDHYIVELHDGRFMVELVESGERFPLSGWKREEIERNLQTGVWREVSA